MAASASGSSRFCGAVETRLRLRMPSLNLNLNRPARLRWRHRCFHGTPPKYQQTWLIGHPVKKWFSIHTNEAILEQWNQFSGGCPSSGEGEGGGSWREIDRRLRNQSCDRHLEMVLILMLDKFRQTRPITEVCSNIEEIMCISCPDLAGPPRTPKPVGPPPPPPRMRTASVRQRAHVRLSFLPQTPETKSDGIRSLSIWK